MKSFLGTVLSRVSLIQRCSGKSCLFKRGMFSWKKNMEKTDLTEKNPLFWDFPGGPVLQTRCCHYRVIRSIPGQGPAISHTPWHCKKKKKHTEKRLLHGLSWHYFYFLFITFNLRKILKYSWFTMCFFQVYSGVVQLYTYRAPSFW